MLVYCGVSLQKVSWVPSHRSGLLWSQRWPVVVVVCVGWLFSPNSVIALSSFGQGEDVPQPVQCPVLLGAAGVDLGVPDLGEQDPAVRVHEAARVPRYGRAVLAAHGPIEGARRRAAERLVGRDIVDVTVEDLRDEAAGVRHECAQGRHCRGRALWC